MKSQFRARRLAWDGLVCLLAFVAASGGLWSSTTAWAHPAGVPQTSALEATTAIVVDRRFDEGAWAAAKWTTGFVERKPVLRATPLDTTHFAVLYDAHAVFVAVRNKDRRPGTIVAKTLTRDSFNLFSDDAISIKLDPHHDHRTTYGFAVNAGGAVLDYKGVNEQRFERGYDMVWSAVAAKTADGWSAEFRIPWSALGVGRAGSPGADRPL